MRLRDKRGRLSIVYVTHTTENSSTQHRAEYAGIKRQNCDVKPRDRQATKNRTDRMTCDFHEFRGRRNIELDK